ncbi:MAG: hypothetical protein QM750_01745 [Rubrivivax sp.]
MKAVSAPAAASSPAPDRRTMGQRLAAAKDLRVFSEEARLHPAAGGLFYQRIAISRCQEVQLLRAMPSDESGDHAIRQRRAKAVEAIERLCGSFTDQELDLARFIDPYEKAQAAQSKDPLLRLRLAAVGLNVQSDRQAADRILADIVRTGDLMLIRTTPVGFDGEGFQFAGSKYRGPAEVSMYSAALLLAGCRLGEACGADDYFVVKTCAGSGICKDGREQAALALLTDQFKLTSEQTAEVLRLRDAMAAALQAGDARPFLSKP